MEERPQDPERDETKRSRRSRCARELAELIRIYGAEAIEKEVMKLQPPEAVASRRRAGGAM